MKKPLNNNHLNNDNFWDKLKKPITGLSPMDGVTDQPYRHIQKKYGNPDVIYTEFTSVEGICHGAEALLKDFLYDESQRPIVAQIYGKTPEYFRQVAIALCQLGFDGIDLNMGCPAKSVDHSGSGAALIKTPKLAQEIIRAAKQGVQDYLNGQRANDCQDISKKITEEIEKRHKSLPKKYQQARNIPISVKTRIGYSTPVVEKWITTLIETKPDLIALHGRTLKQQYSGEANWNEIQKAAKLCHKAGIKVLGNGDTNNYKEIKEKVEKYGVDGVLIGRSSFGNPFVFVRDQNDHKKSEKIPNKKNITLNTNIFEVALDHCRVYEETYADKPRYSFLPMRKNLGWYVRSISKAKLVRAELFKTNSSEEVEQIFKKYKMI